MSTNFNCATYAISGTIPGGGPWTFSSDLNPSVRIQQPWTPLSHSQK